MIKINTVVIAIVIVAILGFCYYIIKRNRKDQRKLEDELNEREVKPEKHEEDHI